MANWHNEDGLYIRYGTEEAEIGKGGEYRTDGQFRVVEVVFNLSSLSETETVLDRNIILPQDVVLYKVEVIADSASATGVAVDVGVVRLDNDATEIDYDGILAAYPAASMSAVGETNVLTNGSSNAGALVGTLISATYPSYITASRTTSTAFTAGRLRVKLFLAPKSSTT